MTFSPTDFSRTVLTNKIEFFNHDVEFEFKFFDVDLDELLRRDAVY